MLLVAIGMKYTDIKFLGAIWQVLAEHTGYELMKKVCQDVVKYNIETNHNIGQDLVFILYDSFYKAQNIILSKCREELIEQSTIISYRGIPTYKPQENDYDIRKLENKIQSLALQLKKKSY